MKIAIGSDHGGFELKTELVNYLLSEGHRVIDMGTDSLESCNYAVYGEKVALAVSNKEVDYGAVICTSGEGIMMAANKVKGIRAGLAYNDEVSKLIRQHNDANVIAFGAKFTSIEEAKRRLKIFLETPFEGGRHQTRVDFINKI